MAQNKPDQNPWTNLTLKVEKVAGDLGIVFPDTDSPTVSIHLEAIGSGSRIDAHKTINGVRVQDQTNKTVKISTDWLEHGVVSYEDVPQHGHFLISLKTTLHNRDRNDVREFEFSLQAETIASLQSGKPTETTLKPSSGPGNLALHVILTKLIVSSVMLDVKFMDISSARHEKSIQGKFRLKATLMKYRDNFPIEGQVYKYVLFDIPPFQYGPDSNLLHIRPPNQLDITEATHECGWDDKTHTSFANVVTTRHFLRVAIFRCGSESPYKPWVTFESPVQDLLEGGEPAVVKRKSGDAETSGLEFRVKA